MIVVVIVVLFKFTKEQIEQNDDNIGYHLAKLKKKEIKQEDGCFVLLNFLEIQTRQWLSLSCSSFKNKITTTIVIIVLLHV
jgi:hypothetical protein